jgi:hypothetical protein
MIQFYYFYANFLLSILALKLKSEKFKFLEKKNVIKVVFEFFQIADLQALVF